MPAKKKNLGGCYPIFFQLRALENLRWHPQNYFSGCRSKGLVESKNILALEWSYRNNSIPLFKKEDAPLSRQTLQFFGQLFSHDSIANFLGHPNLQSKSLTVIDDLLIDFRYIQREKENE